MEKIVLIQLDRLIKRLRDPRGLLKWSPEVVAFLAKEGYDPFFGARPLKRLIQQDVVNMLAKAILEGKIPAHSTIELYMEKDKIAFKLSH